MQIDTQGSFSLVPLDLTSEESLSAVLQQIDHATQFDEDREPQEPQDEGPDFEPDMLGAFT